MSTDWHPRSRDGQLHMVKTWNSVCATKGPEWGIPPDHITQLVTDAQAAEAILDKVKSGERTPADVVQCNMIFKDMETEARFIKKHYLLMPPLTPADFALLLLPLPDEIHTPVGPPTGQPSLTVTYPGGPHLLMVHLAPLPGTEPPDSREAPAPASPATGGRLRLCLIPGYHAPGRGNAGTSRKRQALSDEGAVFRR
jgi:hypothetical protein